MSIRGRCAGRRRCSGNLFDTNTGSLKVEEDSTYSQLLQPYTTSPTQPESSRTHEHRPIPKDCNQIEAHYH